MCYAPSTREILERSLVYSTVMSSTLIRHENGSFSQTLYKAWFKRRILHAPNQILILVDSNEYVRLIWFKRRIFLPNKIAEREWRVLNYHSGKHKLFNIIWIRFGTYKIRRLNQLSNFSRIFDRISPIFDWLALNWNMSHLTDLDVAFCMHLIRQFDSAHVKCDV